MKIAVLMPHLQIYGGVRRIIELSNRLVQWGHDLTIYHSNGASCTWMECYAKTKPALDIVNGEFDVLIYDYPTKHDLDLALLTNAKLKVFFCLELYNKELMLPGFKLEKLFARKSFARHTRLLKKELMNNDLLLVNASWMKSWLKENLGLEATLLLGGVNTEMFHPVPVSKDASVIRIVYSGDPRERKGTKIVEAALDIVKSQLPNVVIETYYGKGIPQSQMAEIYSSADIFVDGQFSAGWNNPVAEAMACKAPVVCTNIGGVQDFAFDEKTALLVQSHDVEAMARAILRLALNPELRAQLSENAYEHIRTFKWDESARKLESILENALRQLPANYQGRQLTLMRRMERFSVEVFWIHYHRYFTLHPEREKYVQPLGLLKFMVRRWRTGST